MYSVSVNTTAPREDGAWTIARGDLLLAIGNGAMLAHSITTDEIVIGRDSSCDFVIDHASLSRRHAVVRVASPPTVQDLGSTNGFHVGGAHVRGGEPIALVDRAGFQIGPFSFVLVARGHAGNPSVSGRNALHVADPLPDGVPSLVREFARSDACVLINGETGAGKEVLATTVHALSGRSGELVQVNCAALSETLLESELFGYERGAFTGAVGRKAGLIESAAGGTVFLDEIGEIPLAVQAKLLRAIERREVLRLGSTRPIKIDVRFIAATNRNLGSEVAAGRFRADLFYRLDGVTLVIPPLRDRRGSIVPLALRFLAAVAPKARLTAAATSALEQHPWPGNVRELKAVIERASVLSRGRDVDAVHLAFSTTTVPALAAPSTPATPPPPPPPVPPEVPLAPPPSSAALDERARIEDALARCAGNQSRAAALLGISRTTLITKLRIYKIARPHGKE